MRFQLVLCLLRIDIAEPSLIALNCETANISDCDVDGLPSLPNECKGVFSLVFSDDQRTCGSVVLMRVLMNLWVKSRSW